MKPPSTAPAPARARAVPARPARKPKPKLSDQELALARRTVLEEGAAALGLRWARGRRSDLRRDGRSASGGWPGTLHEARLLIQRDFLTEALGGSANTLTEAERELAVRAAYAAARAEWLRNG